MQWPYEIDAETQEKIKNDDIALMFFGFKYLAGSLFGAKTLKIKDEKIQAKVQEIKDSQGNREEDAQKAYEELIADRDALSKQLNEKK